MNKKILIISLAILIVILVGDNIFSSKEKMEEIIEETTTEETTTEELATEETTSESVTVELVMVGDMLLHDVVQFTGKMPDGTYNYDHFFTHVREDIQSADVAVVNQEVIIGGAAFGISGYPDFN